MSRIAASKSRVDKSRSVTVAPVQQVTVDVIPGRFTEEDWLSLVAAEDGEDVVGEIVDSLISRVMNECYAIYLKRQVVPYTISQACDAVIQMVNWTFVPRDRSEDELETDNNRQEEPKLCANDSWAQGCVPITQLAHTPHSNQSPVWSEHLIADIPEQEADDKTQTMNLPKPPNNCEDPPLPDPGQAEEIPNGTTAVQSSQLHIQPIPPLEPKKTKNRYRPHRGPLRSAGLKNITKSLEETEKEILLDQYLREKEDNKVDESFNLLPTSLHNILKIQLMRPTQKKDLIYDDAGNILSVPKMDLSKLPQYHVNPQVEVLDVSKKAEVRGRKVMNVGVQAPSLPPKRSRRPSGKEAIKYSHNNGLQLDPSSFASQMLVLDDKTLKSQALTMSSRAEDMQGLNPVSAGILLDTIQLSHGVILRDGNTTKRGSVYSLQQREQGWREDRRTLQPIKASITLPSLSVEQLIKNNIPQVQPLVSFI
ncbi:uncharacterized protein C2orf81 homolog [Mixophyes fleayi]|uniref:uncharacterized protein C2orf81 homolog n=1 Tax=Mixophyes fleayi TaxID=3061075 RepID=UPI003F4D80A5